MKSFRLFFHLALCVGLFLACGDNLGERRKVRPDGQKDAPIKKQDLQKPLQKQIPDSTLHKRKKLDALDSLKPSIATLDQ